MCVAQAQVKPKAVPLIDIKPNRLPPNPHISTSGIPEPQIPWFHGVSDDKYAAP
jgi:hypothetical protein